ncbi:hypothetical protein JTE90_016610 [Oedothorax gibbosus]|uniref:EF-hand domain-containing protein n=1 Tax=Oedothorax gibbosus TaxID=931172 RepID=A0AAV6TG77_9ARAC|nr:hypothetical protein JTE90_016610 [Oedothorax gibbosus]
MIKVRQVTDSSNQSASGGLQTVFDAFAKSDGNEDGKISCEFVQQWLKKAGVSGISEDDIKKNFDKEQGGLDFNKFKQGIEKLAKDANQGKDDIMKKLTSVLPTTAKLGEKIDDLKSKLDSADKETIDKNSTGALQKVFDSFAKLGGNKDGKISCDSVQQWLKKADVSGISEDDVKKNFDKDGGLDFNEFKQGVEKLAKDANQGKEDILKKLTSVSTEKNL